MSAHYEGRDACCGAPLGFNQMMRQIGGVSHRILTPSRSAAWSAVAPCRERPMPPSRPRGICPHGRGAFADRALRIPSNWAIECRPVIERARAGVRHPRGVRLGMGTPTRRCGFHRARVS